MNPEFLDGVAALSKWYFAEVPVSTRVWVGKMEVIAPGKGEMGRPHTGPWVVKGTPPPQEVRQIAAQLPVRAWARYTIKEASKGPIEADFAMVRATSKAGAASG